jgi:TolA-binding protein
MSAAIIVLVATVVILAVVLIAGVALMRSQSKGSERLQEKFGTEYDRTLGESDSKQNAEAQLRDRQERVEQLHLRELGTDERVRLSRAWATTQTHFVDEPGAAIAEAQSLVDEAMSARGYPIGDFAQRAADISVDHPSVVSNYRLAQAIATKNEGGHADTESLRQAMVHYRALFDDLLGGRIEDTKMDDLRPLSRTGGATENTRRQG